jgi:hypothetical protein
MANATEIGFFLSGGSTNTNVNKSTGGAISNQQIIQKSYNNLWSDVSERQIRYGWKTLRIIYLKNLSSTETFKNARVYWRESDTYTTIQIGRAGVNATENSTLSTASILPTSEELPPSLWDTAVAAADTFSIVQDFNNTDRDFGNFFGGSDPDAKMGVGINDTSAKVCNQKITRMTFLLKRMGTARGNVNCKIWHRDGEVRANLGSIDSDDLNEAGQSPPEPFTKAVFTNTSNNYACQVGDVIGLEYPGGGQDEDSGDDDENILLGNWAWDGANEQGDPDNVQYDIEGTSEYRWRENDGFWFELNHGQSETIYRAEISGSSSPTNPGPTDPSNPIPLPTNPDGNCTPTPGDPGDGEQPPSDQPLEGFLLIQDFNDLAATTGYTVGGVDGFRRAIKVDNTTATILSAPIARMTFLLRRIGNPSGSIWCRIWNSSGVVMQTLGGIPVTSISNQSNQFSQVPFTLQDNAYQMKVGDLVGLEFTSGTADDHIVVGGWSWRSAGSAAAAAEAGLPEATAVSDSRGVKMIYANTGTFDYDWEIPSNSNSMRWDNVNPPLNAEMTGYFFKSSPSSDTISCKIRGGRHTDGQNEDGCCYIPQFPTTGGTMQFEIECPHPENHDCDISGTTGTSLSMGTWHGYKCAWWNDNSGCVHIEAWQDKGDASGSTPPNQWQKVFSHIDCNGDCGDIDNPLTRPKGSTSQCTFRIDENSGTQGKWLSVVAITPGGVQQPGDPNTPPSDPNNPGDPSNPPPSGARDIPGTSIAHWTGSAPWIADDAGQSDLVFRAERYSVDPEKEQEEKIIIDPGTARKPTTYDQGIVLKPFGPGDYQAIILEQKFFPSPQTGEREIEQSLVVEVDATTSPTEPTDAGNPPSAAGLCPPGQYLDPIQGVCVEEAGSPGSTTDGIILPSLPTTSYEYDTINYTEVSDHRANGSFREYFERHDMKDLNNVLIGGYIQVDGPDDETITANLGGGIHSPSDGGRAGRCYNIHIRFAGDSVSVTKEDPHANYHDTGIDRTISVGARQGHYTGVMFMKVNVLVLGQECVRLLAWVDTAGMNDAGVFTSGNQNWVKVLDEIDNGNLYGKPWLTPAVAGNSIVTLRIDQQEEASYDAKFLFATRINGPVTSY